MNDVDALPVEDELDTLSDRELLLAIAKDIRATKVLIAEVAEMAGPLLNSPKFKLLSKML